MKLRDISFSCDFGFWAIMALSIYFTNGTNAFLIAAAAHEAAHIAAIFLLTKGHLTINLKAAGIYIKPCYCENISVFDEVLILLSGPVGGLIFGVALKNRISGIFEICAALSLINLVPIRGTDGGGILRAITNRESILNDNAQGSLLLILLAISAILAVKFSFDTAIPFLIAAAFIMRGMLSSKELV